MSACKFVSAAMDARPWQVIEATKRDMVEVYVEEGVFEKSKKKLNDFKGDEVVVIDGVEVELVVEGEDEGEVQVEAEVQLDEEGFVEVEVQGEDEAGVVGEMEVVVEGVDVDDVGACYTRGARSRQSCGW